MKVITYNLFVGESGDQPSLQYGKGLVNSWMTLIGKHAESGAGADLYQKRGGRSNSRGSVSLGFIIWRRSTPGGRIRFCDWELGGDN